jgi:PadR family transcriptional regulator PadR
MSQARSNPEFLNGVPEMLILQLLARKPMYGYELVQAIRDATDQVLTFGEGCIYPILHRLERKGQLTSRHDMVGKRSRLVYRVTKSGQKKLAQSVAQWQWIAKAIHQIIGGGDHGAPVYS